MIPIPKFSTSFGEKHFKNHVVHSEFQLNKQKLQSSSRIFHNSSINGKKCDDMWMFCCFSDWISDYYVENNNLDQSDIFFEKPPKNLSKKETIKLQRKVSLLYLTVLNISIKKLTSIILFNAAKTNVCGKYPSKIALIVISCLFLKLNCRPVDDSIIIPHYIAEKTLYEIYHNEWLNPETWPTTLALC